jgi:hypothetical protein
VQKGTCGVIDHCFLRSTHGVINHCFLRVSLGCDQSSMYWDTIVGTKVSY